MIRLTKIEIAGFKSIRSAQVELSRLNVLIGANGAGKSNFVSFFALLDAVNHGRLPDYVGQEGGAHSLLYRGPKRTSQVVSKINFESVSPYDRSDENSGPKYLLLICAYGAADTLVPSLGGESPIPWLSGAEVLGSFRAFQFHDTSKESRIRQSGYLDDNRRLQRDAGNLAAFLYRLQQTKEPCYRRIVATIQQVTPFFHDFDLAPDALNPRNILLNWRERGSDYLLGPHQLSDGSLRAMALISLLLQPEDELPDVILIDEPELGLHPAALQVLVSLLRSISVHSQVIVATQSVPLINSLEPEDIIVVERGEEGTTFHRQDPERLREWLEEYTLGELWEKNVIGGRPSR
jgi:predicted ATPase